MKILILIQCSNLGGMEHNMLLFLNEIRGMNFEVEVVSINPMGKLGELLADRKIPYEGSTYRGPWGMGSLLKLHRILALKKADALLMIGHNFMGQLAIGSLWRNYRTLALHYHHTGERSPLFWKIIYGIAQLQFRSVVFVSDYIMKEALELAPFLRKKTWMVGTPVDVHRPFTLEERADARAVLGIDEKTLVVGNAGWLVQRKRWDVFLNVAGEVVKHDDRIRFVIAGDGPLRTALERQARELGIQDKVIWLGWQSKLKSFYRAIDILLFNSDWDAQARTPLEAMSHGIPVVASILSGGTKEVIENDQMGFLLDTHDTKRLADQILDFARNPELRHFMGENGRQRIAEYGSPKLHAVKILESMGFSSDHDAPGKWRLSK